MSVTVGFQSNSKTADLTYFDVSVPTNGSSHTITNLKWTNQGKPVKSDNNFGVNSAQLSTVPKGVEVTIQFETQKIVLNEKTTSAPTPQASGATIFQATISAKA